MIVDGRQIAEEIVAGLRDRRRAMGGSVTLGIIVGTGDPVIESFVRIKSKLASDLAVAIERKDISDATTESVIDAIRTFKFDPSIDGIIVQLPMPERVDVNAVLSEVNVEKDVDGINPFTRERDRPVHAPVALAVQEILRRYDINPAGKRVVVVGAGRLVGLPSAALLRDVGAEVSMVTLEEGTISDLKEADIIVSGAGQPHFIKPEHIRNGVVLIDAGTSESGGVIQGDAHPDCADIAQVFTPVPGGVGPIAVAMIFKNLLDLAAITRRG